MELKGDVDSLPHYYADMRLRFATLYGIEDFTLLNGVRTARYRSDVPNCQNVRNCQIALMRWLQKTVGFRQVCHRKPEVRIIEIRIFPEGRPRRWRPFSTRRISQLMGIEQGAVVRMLKEPGGPPSPREKGS